MNSIDFQKFKARCSAISKLLSNSRSNPQLTEKQKERLDELQKKEALTEKQKAEMAELNVKKDNSSKIILSDTCIEYLMEAYAWETEGCIPISKESMDIAAIKKGRMMQAEAAKLLTLVDGIEYKEHKERISNDYLTGEVDLYAGEHIYAARNVTDIKNKEDYPGFLKNIHTGLLAGQEEQLQGYGDITGAKDLFIANTLVNTPDDIILDYQYRLAKKMGSTTTESPEFKEEWKKWERSMNFDRILPQKRVFKIRVDPFTPFQRQQVYDRVKVCRDWLCLFHENYQKFNQ